MNHGGLFRGYVQIQRKTGGCGAEMVLSVIRRSGLYAPMVDPHVEATGLGTGLPNAGSTYFFRVAKLMTVMLRQGGMRQIEMSDGPP
jgi:hypothetical protein